MWTLGSLTVRGRASRMVVRHMDYAELLQQVQAAAGLDRVTAGQGRLGAGATPAGRRSKPHGGEAYGLRRVAAAGAGSGGSGPGHGRAGELGDGDNAGRADEPR